MTEPDATAREPLADPARRIESGLSPEVLKIAVLSLLAIQAVIKLLYALDFGDYVITRGDSWFFIDLARQIARGDVLLDHQSLIFSPLLLLLPGGIFRPVRRKLPAPVRFAVPDGPLERLSAVSPGPGPLRPPGGPFQPNPLRILRLHPGLRAPGPGPVVFRAPAHRVPVPLAAGAGNRPGLVLVRGRPGPWAYSP